MTKAALKPPSLADDLYETDFFAWTQAQADSLRQGRFDALDIVNLIDEVESVGRSQRAAIESHLTVLIIHLLKFRVQPSRITVSWRVTLRNQRRDIQTLIARNPSLRAYPAAILAEVYPDAVRRAAQETRMDEADFPSDLPFTLTEILDPDFVP